MSRRGNAGEERRWRQLGATDAYWAVCTEPRYRAERLTPEGRAAFFASGESEVEQTLAAIERHLAQPFRPAVVIDYGCGVGRLAIPLARRADQVLGLDISETMLAEARSNAETRNVANVRFAPASELWALESESVDLVHSYIVLQHIHPREGMEITRQLLRVLRPGGVGALHYTFSWSASPLRKLLHAARRLLPPLNVAANAITGRRLTEPMIPVHQYDIVAVLELIASCHGAPMLVLPTDHGGHFGAMLIFRRAQ